MNFQKQFVILKGLGLPVNEFVVVGSGALSVRSIRDSEDIDLIATKSFWDKMIKKFKVGINNSGVEHIELGPGVEMLNPTQSIFGNSKSVPLDEIFEKADIFDGIKFINLNHLARIKKELGREKDLRDIALINDYFKTK